MLLPQPVRWTTSTLCLRTAAARIASHWPSRKDLSAPSIWRRSDSASAWFIGESYQKNQARFSCEAGSDAGGGSRSLLYPHSSSAQRRVVPFLRVFSSRNGLPHCGHFSSTGLSQKTVSHFG